jgi:hypothetical protein
MRKLVVGILVALLVAMTGGTALADPLGLLSGAAIIPYFNTSPTSLSFLVLASPVSDVGPSEHLFYYTASCIRQESSFTPLTENDTLLWLINGQTSLEEGVILVAGTNTGTDITPLLDPFVARLLWWDGTVDHGRVIDPAGAFEFQGAPGAVSFFVRAAWPSFHSGAVLPFMPPDDGATFFDRVIFTCPIGTVPSATQVGVPTLAADMHAFSPFDFTLPATVGLFAVVYDEEEEPINDWTATCQCVGLKPGSASAFTPVIRLRDVNPAYATRTTYTEIQASGTGAETDRFVHHAGIEVHAGGGAADFEWWGRGHPAPKTAIFRPVP